MYRRIMSVIVLLLFFSTSTVLAHVATIQIKGENKYKAVRLTPEIYNKANKDLSDLLIKNSSGEAVPYFLNTGFQTQNTDRETYPMTLIHSYTKNNSFYFDYKLATEREWDTLATSIEVSTGNTNFAKIVDVYGSHDNIHWAFVTNDKFYAIDGISKLSIEFSEPNKYTHYRFKLANNLEEISFDTVDLVYSMNARENNYFIESMTPVFHIEEKDQRTYIKIEGLRNLRLCDVTIETDSMFKRRVSLPLSSGKEIYNLSVYDTSYSDTTLPLDGQISQEDMFTMIIINNDDKPIHIKGITVRYYADEVVFEGISNESYTLDFGLDATKTSPVYDIASYKEEILKGTIDQVSISNIAYDGIEETPVKWDYKFIFNIVVIVTTVLLGGLIVARLKHK
ncbi:hypothetical protein [Petrocella sp. FN5]|uniref:hypothetical protein n=1 Tax=Petrocella sp. FN5 TaxID=3032002 RepID=UPI0023DB5E0F|nr:hypothetical protein [Petrocella sp. FN5]MDF1616491.1 hypothetical protein [Petrocella sp. FN5]